MTETITLPDYRAMDDDQLADLYAASGDDEAAAIRAELARRDKADRLARARKKLQDIRAEGWSAAYSQYLECEAAVKGRMLSREGDAAGVNELDLWRIPEDQAQRYASEEVRDYWTWVAPRITPAQYVRQTAAQNRAEREQARRATDERDDRAGLAGDEAGAFRHDATASETPETGQRGAVDRGRPAPVTAEDITEDDRAGRAGRTVRPGLGREERDDMGLGTSTASGSTIEPDAETGADLIRMPLSGAAILNDSVNFSKTIVHMSDEMHDAAALAAMVTHTVDSFTTLPRLAAISLEPQSGKSTLVNYFTMVVSNPWDPDPTSYALRAKFTERERPTPIFEEIHEYYGRGGNRSGNKDLNKILKQGYQKSASLSHSVQGVSEDVSCFCVAILAGLRNAVPDEIYSRCIVWKMTGVGPGIRLRDSLDDDVQAIGVIHGMRMHQWAKTNGSDVKRAFRNLRRVHPALFSRLKQIWGPLFAVAQVAGEDWPERCLRAFKVMALDTSDMPVLSPEQMVLRDAAAYFTGTAESKAFAADIREHLNGTDEQLYERLSERGMALLMTSALGPAQAMTIGNGRAKGYHAGPVLAAWKRLEAQLEPEADDEPEADEFDSMFDVTEVTDNFEAIQ